MSIECYTLRTTFKSKHQLYDVFRVLSKPGNYIYWSYPTWKARRVINYSSSYSYEQYRSIAWSGLVIANIELCLQNCFVSSRGQSEYNVRLIWFVRDKFCYVKHDRLDFGFWYDARISCFQCWRDNQVRRFV